MQLTEFASFFQAFQLYHFNEPIRSGIDKETSVLSNLSCNFCAQLSNLKAISDYQLQVQASQKLSTKSSFEPNVCASVCKF